MFIISSYYFIITKRMAGRVVVAVDAIILAKSKVLLIKRGHNPFEGRWAFPGGRVDATDKDLKFAAYRELKEETNLTNVELKQVKTVGNNTRDPRGFSVSVVFVGQLAEIPVNGIKAGDDAVDFQWCNVNNLPEMAFDHKEILLEVLEEL